METMFDTLLQLPLFQGLCQEDFTNILDKVKLHFNKHKAGECLISQGNQCNRLCFLLKGDVSMTTTSKDGTYTVIERLNAPHVIEPQSLFGMNVAYSSTYTAHTQAHTVSIDKLPVLTQLFQYEIFRLNMLNIICTKSQRLTRFPWRTRPKDIRHKIARFIEMRCLRPAGEKIVHIKMERLSDEIGESRLNVSRELNAMDAEGIISLRRGEIYVYALEKIIRS